MIKSLATPLLTVRYVWPDTVYFWNSGSVQNINYSRELYLYSKFLHFEEIARVKIAVCFEMIASET